MSRATRWIAVVLAVLASVESAEAGGPFRRRAARVVATTTETNPANANAPSPMLGTFYPTPYVIVGGDPAAGGGYSPLGQYGTTTMVLYGPTSIFRSVTAPVTSYSRGYDGRVYESQGHSFSTPFRPESSPVVYPNANSNYYRPRGTTEPAQRMRGYGWVDQN